MARLQKGERVQVVIADDLRPLYGVVVSAAKKSFRVKIFERDPVWFKAVIHSSQIESAKRCSKEPEQAERAIRWGVSVCEDYVRCPLCGTRNSIRRLDVPLCLSCAMKTCPPIEVAGPPPKPKKAKKKARRQRTLKAA